ncbi:type I methionyl aminopeptidase [Mangrovimicrobium sediminis]|uniref:Methionine aminopeptidase n=1 Tax=Mangrovimicrobium sediminis TaxID=2562682 RepID=A0A4Z0LX55_9GAMM|nr:type I methionyl aminopeptidase [Haliea sp. SAOS-164]TGD71717.1 type I methionyl aminopeptidase [Haliea sp. SAOS-164]
MTIETDRDLAALRRIGRIVASTLQTMMQRAEPGMTTAELDAIGRDLLAAQGANSAPRRDYGFPGYTCISVNEEAAHGVPGARVLCAGDLVNIDVSAELDGYYADTGGSFALPPTDPLKERLLGATRSALGAACRAARHDQPLNGIGRAITRVARDRGFRVMRNLCSHGVGRSLHEEPGEIPGYYEPRDRRRLHEGLVITIEPFLSTKSRMAHEAADGWTLVGAAGNLSAQFEHTMVITRGRPILLTVA